MRTFHKAWASCESDSSARQCRDAQPRRNAMNAKTQQPSLVCTQCAKTITGSECAVHPLEPLLDPSLAEVRELFAETDLRRRSFVESVLLVAGVLIGGSLGVLIAKATGQSIVGFAVAGGTACIAIARLLVPLFYSPRFTQWSEEEAEGVDVNSIKNAVLSALGSDDGPKAPPALKLGLGFSMAVFGALVGALAWPPAAMLLGTLGVLIGGAIGLDLAEFVHHARHRRAYAITGVIVAALGLGAGLYLKFGTSWGAVVPVWLLAGVTLLGALEVFWRIAQVVDLFDDPGFANTDAPLPDDIPVTDGPSADHYMAQYKRHNRRQALVTMLLVGVPVLAGAVTVYTFA